MTPNPSKRIMLPVAAANPSLNTSTNLSAFSTAHSNFALNDLELEQQAAEEEKKQLAQKLYNQWRFLQDQHQDEEKMKAWLEAQIRGYDGLLRPPSPATSMSRQTLRTSSVVGGGDGEDEHLQTSRKRNNNGGIRGGRKSQLAKVAAAKAAYMRVSKKTCDECRRRKVTCAPAPGHYSLDEEEAAYQAWKASQNLPHLPESCSSPDPILADFPAGFQKWMPPGQTQPTELLGVGVRDKQLPPSTSQPHDRAFLSRSASTDIPNHEGDLLGDLKVIVSAMRSQVPVAADHMQEMHCVGEGHDSMEFLAGAQPQEQFQGHTGAILSSQGSGIKTLDALGSRGPVASSQRDTQQAPHTISYSGRQTMDPLIDQYVSHVSRSETHEEIPRKTRIVGSSTFSRDSGYSSLKTVSVVHGGLKTIQEGQGVAVIENQEELDETQTVFSDASSLLHHPDIDKYISTFASELSSSLPPESDASDMERIFLTLPSLLKAFAVRLGHENHERRQRQLMYLVYRFRSEIVERLRHMCKVYHETETAPSTERGGGMNLDDKIRMWQSKEGAPENDTVSACDIDEADLNELADLGDLDETSIPNQSEYRAILAKAPAYQWLRSSIFVKSTLHVPGPGATVSSVEDQIIRAVSHRSKFSRAQTQELRMQFVIDWNPILFSQEQYYDHPVSYVLAHAITLTGSGNNLQAATCESYMKQTWPETGLLLLAFLQRTAERESDTYEDTLPDKMRLSAQLTDSELRVDAISNLFSIAELAEQLAWIGAALRSSPDLNYAAYSTAYISDLNIDNTSNAQAEIHGFCRINFQMELLRDSDLADNGSCWRGMLRSPVIVRGYPIPQRPEAGTGLEIPLDIVAAVTKCRRIVKFAGITFIKGFAAMLVVAKVVGDVVFWHLCYNSNGEYISYEDGRDPQLSRLQSHSRGLGMDALEKSRHIVGWSDQVRNFAGAPDAGYDIEWTDLPSPNAACVLEKIAISGSAVPFVTTGASIAIGVKDKPLHLGFGSGDDYMGNLFTIEKRHFIFYDSEERRAWLVDGVSAVLHLLRAYLKFYLGDSRVGDYFIYNEGDIEEASPEMAYTGAKAAYEVLRNPKNQNLPLYPKKMEESEEMTSELGTKIKGSVTTLKATSTNFILRERVEQAIKIELLIIIKLLIRF